MVKKKQTVKKEIVGSAEYGVERKKEEKTLQESESELTTIFNIVGTGILVIDSETQTILEVNQTAAEIVGRTKENLVGQICHSFICPAEAGKCPIKDLGQNIDNSERKIICADGQRRDILKNVSPFIFKGRKCFLESFIDITERKRVEEALRDSVERFSVVFNINPDPIAVVEGDTGRRILVNSAFVKWSGYSHAELIGATIEQLLVYPEDRARIATQFRNNNGLSDFEIQLRRKNGEISDTQFSVIIIEIGGKTYLFSRIHDITERKIMERAVQESEEQYRLIIANSRDMISTTNIKGEILFVSPAVKDILGYIPAKLQGRPFQSIIHPDDIAVCEEIIRKNILYGEQTPGFEYRVRDKSGDWHWFISSGAVVRDANGSFLHFLGIARDITERKQLEQRLEEMATHDFLTGLPNRVLLLDRFNIAAALAHRNKARLAIMSLDLDKFKSINDTLGHDAGDQVLKAVSIRLTGIIRASDTLARVGGDEFILVMMETNQVDNAATVAQKILDSLIEPLSIGGHQLRLSTSIGIAIYPEDAQDMETLTKKSDAAMYYSKGHGRNQFKFFSDGDVSISGDHKSAAN